MMCLSSRYIIYTLCNVVFIIIILLRYYYRDSSDICISKGRSTREISEILYEEIFNLCMHQNQIIEKERR